MYQSIYYDGKPNYKFHLRDDKTGWSEFSHTLPRFQIDVNGQYQTLDGKRAKQVTKYDWNDNHLYESDIDRLTAVLIDKYKDSDDTPEWQNVIYFDIECEIGGALTTEYIKTAPMKITSIALYDATGKKHYCLILDEKKQLQSINEENRQVIPCDDEFQLLSLFLELWETVDPTIITGWNSGFFDVPYLYYRLCNVLGKDEAARLSPLRKFKFTEWDQSQPIEIAGINHLDYLLLYKKYNPKNEPSYKLNDIGTKYVNLGKVEYEGNLDRLFREDVNKFIEYNIRDVEIIIELEKKFKFIELTVAICHLCHVPYEQIYLSTVLNDGAILTYLKRNNIVSPNKPTTTNPALKPNVFEVEDEVKSRSGTGKKWTGYIKNIKGNGLIDVFVYETKHVAQFYISNVVKNEEYAGGYLKDPVPGLYEWVIDLDFTSLYPSIIRSLNIGIETFVGRIVNKDKYDNNWTLDDLKQMDPESIITIEKLTPKQTTQQTNVKVGTLIAIIEDNDWLISAPGVMFRTDKSSVVCEVLTDWFNKRVEYKNAMKKAYKSGDAIKGEFYNRRQHAYKIKLNDVYGCYAINSWRYTDGHKMISKAITLSGQRLIQESIKFCNEWMNKQLNTEDKDYVVTSDTDSLFIQVKDLALLRHPELVTANKEEWTKAILIITSEVQKAANEYINTFARKAFNIKDREHYFELKQEVVLERGYFAGKRRYAMYIVNKEGVTVDELDMKGLDLMKSNMTPMYSKFGEQLIKDIMFGKPKPEIDQQIIDFKKHVKDIPIDLLAKPTGVKNVESYIERTPKSGEIFSALKLKCPINAKAAIHYNDLLKFKRVHKQYPLFTAGDKMKYIQLKTNPYNIDVIGFTGNDPDFINKFIDEFADREEGFESSLLNKLKGIYEDLGWSFPSLNDKVNKFFRFV
jgi:DNA polymerase elongation subunit (family B)